MAIGPHRLGPDFRTAGVVSVTFGGVTCHGIRIAWMDAARLGGRSTAYDRTQDLCPSWFWGKGRAQIGKRKKNFENLINFGP
jgi:hypothetical protein